MTFKFYDLLGIQKGANQDEIKKAYRKKALEYHPDRNPSPEAKAMFITIDTAYRRLLESKDPTKPQHKPYKNPNPKQTRHPSKTKDIWDVENKEFKDSMAGQYGYSYYDEAKSVFKDSMAGQYESEIKPIKPRRRPIKQPEPEVDLWENYQDSMADYWAEYNRLKNASAYEDPESFWEKLDAWVEKQRNKKKKPKT